MPEKTDRFKSGLDNLAPMDKNHKVVGTYTNRREFLKKIAALTIITSFAPAFAHKLKDLEGKIVTVTGAILPGKMGVSLIHEHVMSAFGEEKKLNPGYDTEKLFAQVLPYLKKIKGLG